MSVTKIERAVHSFSGQSSAKKLPKDAEITDIPTFMPIVLGNAQNGQAHQFLFINSILRPYAKTRSQGIIPVERRATPGPTGAPGPARSLVSFFYYKRY